MLVEWSLEEDIIKLKTIYFFAGQRSYQTFATLTVARYLFGNYGQASFFFSEVLKAERLVAK